jgi:hypothetical protein
VACAFVLLLAFVAGEVAARYQPEAAVRFQQAAADGQSRIPASARLPLALGVPLTLFLLLVWQSGKFRKPLFLPFGFFLCLGAASVGMIRGGHDVDMERSAADFQSRVTSLRKELDVWKQSAARQMSDKEKTMGASLAALEIKLQETQADRNKMAGSLQKSSMALQERDEIVTSLRKEIEDLKKKLAEKD